MYKCGVSRAGKDQKGNSVAFIFRFLMSEACKKEVVAVTMALQCLGQKGWYRWAAASLTEMIKSPFFPNQTSYLERSNENEDISSSMLFDFEQHTEVYHIISFISDNCMG